MTAQDPKLQVCPIRIDGSGVLFAHRVDTKTCQERQRKRYHKCFTCAWNNGYVSANGEPKVAVESTPSVAELATTA